MKQDLFNLISSHNNELDGLSIDSDLNEYIEKLFVNAKIITVHENGALNGFIAYYKNDIINKNAFLTLILVDKQISKKGIGSFLIESAISDLKINDFDYFNLEVLKSNSSAIKFYEKYGFKIISDKNNFWAMNLDLNCIENKL
jgi:ribosomal protein S18 acetylase RimI-like enzyme